MSNVETESEDESEDANKPQEHERLRELYIQLNKDSGHSEDPVPGGESADGTLCCFFVYPLNQNLQTMNQNYSSGCTIHYLLLFKVYCNS